MSEDDKFPGPPPPDDFSKTTPNINVGGADSAQYDWDKTNYNLPKQPTGDDWGKTITNLKPIDTDNQDFSKTFYPGSQSVPPAPDWGVTNANVRVNPADFGSSAEDFGAPPAGGGYEKTTPYFRLPDAERAKYQNLPPTPTEKAEQERKQEEQKGGIRPWMWWVAGLTIMFVFGILAIGFVAYMTLYDPFFEVTVKSAPLGSRILVDDQQVGIESEDGTYKLVNLNPGGREIKIIHPTHDCRVESVKGAAGENVDVTARCRPKEIEPDKCQSFEINEFEKAELCYYKALSALTLPPTAPDLVNALNILIINFETNKHDIPPPRLEALKKGAEYIKQLPPDIVLEIGGHTDNQGGDDVNIPLSQRRAEAVKQKLVEFGVRKEALQTRGYGSTQPRSDVDPNTDRGRFFNRRIKYSIVQR